MAAIFECQDSDIDFKRTYTVMYSVISRYTMFNKLTGGQSGGCTYKVDGVDTNNRSCVLCLCLSVKLIGLFSSY